MDERRMLGLLVHESQWNDADRVIENNNLCPDEVVQRLHHWRLYIFQSSSRRTVAAVVFRLSDLLSGQEKTNSYREAKIIENETVSAVIGALSQPKVGALTTSEADGFRKGYDVLAARGLIGDANALAHRAWVTRKIESHLIGEGRWSHHVTVTVEFAGFRESVSDLAVSEDHAARKAAKMRRDIRQRLGFVARDPRHRFATLICSTSSPSPQPHTPPFSAPARASAIETYRAAILTILSDGRVATSRDLQAACQTEGRREKNLAAWALVHLQKDGRIVKVGSKSYRLAEVA